MLSRSLPPENENRVMDMSSTLPLSLACFLLMPTVAFGDSWTSEVLSTSKGYPHMMLILSIIAVVLLIIFAFLLRRVGSRSSLDSSIGMGLDDLKSIEKKGLLTQEEMQRVRQAMARQMTKKLDNKKPAGGLVSLMADPEIIRLQEMAEAKRAQRTDPTQTQEPSTPEQPESFSADPVPAVPQTEGETPAVAQTTSDASPDSLRWQYEPTAVQSTADDVQLPPDVLGMAKLGLITEEELENIKARIRDKKKKLGTS